jgi:hypothetical protein
MYIRSILIKKNQNVRSAPYEESSRKRQWIDIKELIMCILSPITCP